MSGKKVREPRERCFFECLVNGEKGMFVGTVDAESRNPNVSKDAIRVIYIPLKDVNKKFFERWKLKIREESLWKTTKAKYPGEKALVEFSSTTGMGKSEGLFDKEIKAVQNCEGQSPWFEDKVGKTFEQNLAKVTAKKNNLQDQLGRSEVEKQGLKNKAEQSQGSSRKEDDSQNSGSDELNDFGDFR